MENGIPQYKSRNCLVHSLQAPGEQCQMQAQDVFAKMDLPQRPPSKTRYMDDAQKEFSKMEVINLPPRTILRIEKGESNKDR